MFIITAFLLSHKEPLCPTLSKTPREKREDGRESGAIFQALQTRPLSPQLLLSNQSDSSLDPVLVDVVGVAVFKVREKTFRSQED